MKRKVKLPTHEIVLDTKDPLVQQMVINTFRSAKIRIYRGTTGFDPFFPSLVWDGNQLGRTMSEAGKVPLSDFLACFFEGGVREVKLNDEYTARVVDGKQTVQVGCQTIPFKAVEELYKAVQASKKRSE